MKRLLSSVIILGLLALAPGCNSKTRGNRGIPALGAAESDNPIAVIMNHYAARTFTNGAVTQTELDQILAAGAQAPSASNRQPWHFTVVQNQNLTNQMIPNINDGNILIIISAFDGQNNGQVILDCALATQSIYLAAQALGLGSRIYTGPINTINQRFKTDLGLPSGYSAVTLVRVGRLPPGIDAVSAASSRKPLDSIVTYK
ncbi:MAG: nitroreductase family protein [Treponema sp.]|jgi:nitroreductase|nr:nitroreductase family protein [Treponema sp.]